MKISLFGLLILSVLCLPSFVFAQSDANQTNISQEGSNTQIVVVSNSQLDSPWAENSKICIFVREWILKGMFLVVILVFLAGVATISGAAFPEWRDYGSKMVLGSIGAMVLYIIGMQALRFFMGTTICGL